MLTDTVLTAAGGPYIASNPMAIAPDVTLTVEPGVVLQSPNILFAGRGTLRVEGTEANPVRLTSTRRPASLGVVWAESSMRVTLRHVLAAGFSGPVSKDGPASLLVENCRFWTDEIYSTSPLLTPGATFRHNEFINSGAQSVDTGTPGDQKTLFSGNRWVRTNQEALGPAITVAWGSGLIDMVGNSFTAGTWSAIEAPNGDGYLASPIRLAAEGNYWGSTDPAGIGKRILDRNDGLGYPYLVDYDPFLTAPPTASLFEPLPPKTVAATAGPRSAQVAWSAPLSDGGAAVSQYRVTAYPGGASATAPGSATGVTVPGLSDGTSYTFTVTATNAVGTSQPSSTYFPVTPASPPGAPRDVTAVSGDGEAVVEWSPPTEGAATVTGYTVTSSPGGRTVSVSGNTHSATVGRLANGTPYTFTVTAKNDVGTSGPSAPSAPITPAGKPGKVSKPTVAVKKSTVTVTWRAPANNGSPVVKYAVSSPTAGVKTVTAPATTAVFTGLKKGTYIFKVAATNAIGTGPTSKPVKAVVK